ncbi:SgcJ/EcaC family oxidoreductase [Bradyrhizobium sp. S69]|uniref:YybH family protein n=1 Tax=Bradyrhizobium sp. S69 TaxID=1641856 RepID=UPI00131E8947|nr:SgcJ/EcaC family oxidoreductase [Bradyrhizobium sp. S69]
MKENNAMQLSLPDAAPLAAAAIARWMLAFNARNIDEIVSLYAPDASIHGTTYGVLAIGSDAIHSYFGGAFRSGVSVKLTSTGVTIRSGDILLSAGHYEFSGTGSDGTAYVTPARFTFVLGKMSDVWLIVHHHSSTASASR